MKGREGGEGGNQGFQTPIVGETHSERGKGGGEDLKSYNLDFNIKKYLQNIR